MELTFGPWQGIDALQARLSALSRLQGLDGELEAEGDEVVKEARVYPAERPGQRYVRTYDLRDSWDRRNATRRGRTIQTVVENAMSYGPHVMGEDQATAHKGRWRKLRTIAENRRGAIRSRAQAWALKVWRGG